eukprot:Gregarina_sp_Poly_1__6902@NODE_3745_length_899_cov_252_225962_g2403_i0_p1_GENE_NODE_3745_length_899_cov_252_225962_g2403_i0NODE_3745_length_899_cov_252_225962_g2403_i0_p1_ORF_typecomplete_len273_score28_76_NODE_3745_length_899_cov_252_225962_g2403_i041859
MSLRRLVNRFQRKSKQKSLEQPDNDRKEVARFGADPGVPAEIPAEPCPSFDDFGAESGQFFSLDLIEGCRVVTTRALPCPKFIGGDVMVSHTLNLGTYPSLGSQASLLKALFQTSQGEQLGPQGGRNWSSFLKWSNGPQSLITSYSSRSDTVEARAATRVCEATSVRCGLITSQLLSHLGHLGRSILGRKLLTGFETLDTSNDLGMAVVERSTESYSLTSKVTYQGSPITTVSLAARLYSRLWGGGDVSWMVGLEYIFGQLVGSAFERSDFE